MAADANSASDGRNAVVIYTASAAGTYQLHVLPEDGAGEYLLRVVDASASQVQSRYVFYNNSAFDGRDPGAGPTDDSAIAADKTALLPGQTATFANYTSFDGGINGIMVDLPNIVGQVTAADFQLAVGKDDQPQSWPAAPAPSQVMVRDGQGVGGSDRVTLVWEDGAIVNQWLRVEIKANRTTGLREPDVFYFGNIVGESGNASGNTVVDSADELAARRHSRHVCRSRAARRSLRFQP